MAQENRPASSGDKVEAVQIEHASTAKTANIDESQLKILKRAT